MIKLFILFLQSRNPNDRTFSGHERISAGLVPILKQLLRLDFDLLSDGLFSYYHFFLFEWIKHFTFSFIKKHNLVFSSESDCWLHSSFVWDVKHFCTLVQCIHIFQRKVALLGQKTLRWFRVKKYLNCLTNFVAVKIPQLSI